MAGETSFLRRPIPAVINGQWCELLTTGHLARAVGRTPRTLRTWQAMNLLPQAPFVLDYHSVRQRRWLYPAAFVERMAEIADSGIIGKRMKHWDYFLFEHIVDDAEAEFINPLLAEGVSRPVLLQLVR